MRPASPPPVLGLVILGTVAFYAVVLAILLANRALP